MIAIFNQIVTILLIINNSAFSQNGNQHNIDLKESIEKNQSQEYQIRSIQIFKTGSELSEPVIELGSNESITLTFDDLSDNSKNFSYSIIHCTSTWKETGLIKSDYIDGFEINPINDYKNSYATTVPYTHYKLQIPNNDIKIKISGNYIIRVVDTYNADRIVLEQRFMVFEPILSINAKTRQPIGSDQRSTSQQLELSIATNSMNISNPYTDLIPYIIQNGQTDCSLLGLKPVFIRADELVYSSPENLIFNGINEYRSFDINSIRYISPGIQSIDQTGGEYSVQLQPSENNRKHKYSNLPDINGYYTVKLERSEMSDIEADYVWVYFTLPYYDQLQGKEVYVYGELTDWQCSPQNLMQYSFQRNAYELRLLLKQGYYNYRYVVRDVKTGEIDHTFFEGNHFETENSYLILAYYKQPGKQYERIVGVKRINSRNPN